MSQETKATFSAEQVAKLLYEMLPQSARLPGSPALWVETDASGGFTLIQRHTDTSRLRDALDLDSETAKRYTREKAEQWEREAEGKIRAIVLDALREELPRIIRENRNGVLDVIRNGVGK